MSDVSAAEAAVDPEAVTTDEPAAAPTDAAPAPTADDQTAVAVPTPVPPSVGGVLGVPSGGGLDKLVNVALEVSVELGRTRVTLSEVLDYDVGSVVELDRAAGAPVDVRVNDTLLAQGEVVLIDDEYAVRITAIFDPNQPHR